MINTITNNTSVISTTQQVSNDIQEALSLLKAAKTQDATNTTHQMKDLLIEYIIANMRGDTSGAQSILDQLNSLITKYGQDIEHADDLKEKLNQMAKNPSPSDLSYLQGLIADLQHDVSSGDLSNLTSFE